MLQHVARFRFRQAPFDRFGQILVRQDLQRLDQAFLVGQREQHADRASGSRDDHLLAEGLDIREKLREMGLGFRQWDGGHGVSLQTRL